jgi:hypothetical protein
MPLSVIGAGLGRTGTLSLKTALEELGFDKCYHMTDVMAHLEHAAVWDAAARGEPVDWESLFQGYQATVDWPGCNFFEEFVRLYPDAKVILTVRDPERWYESARQTIYYIRHAFPSWLRLVVPRMRTFNRMLDRLIWDGTFHGKFSDKSYAIAVFNQFNDRVQRIVPAERLLVYEIQDGWRPLCEFLGQPVPEGKPFPHRNDTAEFRSRVRRAVLIMRVVGYSVLGGLALVVAWLASKALGL